MSKITRAIKRLRVEREAIKKKAELYRPGGPLHIIYAARLRAIDAQIAEKEAML